MTVSPTRVISTIVICFVVTFKANVSKNVSFLNKGKKCAILEIDFRYSKGEIKVRLRRRGRLLLKGHEVTLKSSSCYAHPFRPIYAHVA